MRVMVALLLAIAAQAQQQPAARAEFEVVSVKPGDPASMGSSWGTPPGRVVMRNVTLKFLVMDTYRLNEYQLDGGPKWIDSAKFNVDAKLPAGAPQSQIPLMMQVMLADRFKLEVHRETKTRPEYELVVAKGGPKLQAAREGEPNPGSSSTSEGGGQIQIGGNGVTIPSLIGRLTGYAGAPILDRTGLAGQYTFTLKFAPLLETSVQDESLPAIFAAVQQQLGLKLEAIKGPVEVLVIDRAEMPTAN
jgi:uncharacterized protein (TIGR03435 family)